MSYLKMALQAMKAATLDSEVGAPEPELVGQVQTHTSPDESPRVTLEARPVTCESCPWYALNPWTHYPDFGAWCHHQMEHLVVGSPACEEFRHGEVPLRQNHERVPQVHPSTSPALQAPVLGERVLNTMDRTRARGGARTAVRLF